MASLKADLKAATSTTAGGGGGSAPRGRVASPTGRSNKPPASPTKRSVSAHEAQNTSISTSTSASTTSTSGGNGGAAASSGYGVRGGSPSGRRVPTPRQLKPGQPPQTQPQQVKSPGRHSSTQLLY